jgi:hypothetical protein
MAEASGAEKSSTIRAILMIVGAIIIAVNMVIQWGDPAYSGGGRAIAWIVLMALWAALLATGGGLRLSKHLREVLNDELTRANRSRAIAAGFYATLLTSMVALASNWSTELLAGDAIKLASSVGLATALLSFAWLEIRSSY